MWNFIISLTENKPSGENFANDWCTFLSASIFSISLRRSRIQRLLRLVWYIFSDGTQDFGRRSGGRVIPYSHPTGKSRFIVKMRCFLKIISIYKIMKSRSQWHKTSQSFHTLIVHRTLQILAPLNILPHPAGGTLDLIFRHGLFSILPPGGHIKNKKVSSCQMILM